LVSQIAHAAGPARPIDGAGDELGRPLALANEMENLNRQEHGAPIKRFRSLQASPWRPDGTSYGRQSGAAESSAGPVGASWWGRRLDSHRNTGRRQSWARA